MARFHKAHAILEAAARWRDECLLNDGSILSDRNLWTPDNLDHLVRYFVENPDTGEGDFFGKLDTQLEAAPPEGKQLAAELFWVLYLIVTEAFMSAKTKRFQIRKVWGWSGESLPEEHWALGGLLEQGVANPGTAYNTHRWRELRFFITAMKDWKALGRENRRTLLKEPWEFARWLEDREHAPARQFRHVLLFLLFPDDFERIATASHKRRIVRSFREKWDEHPEAFDYSDRIALDREVLRIRRRLEKEAEGDEIDFYDPSIRQIWSPEAPEGESRDDSDLPPGDEAESWFRARFGDVRVWALSAGVGGRM